MYTVCSLGNIPIEDFVKESLPFFLALMILIAILIAFPKLSLFLPGLMK